MTITEFQNENRYLSNFYNSPFYFEGLLFKTAEHFYQMAKAKNPKDKAEILNASTPFVAKKLGASVELIDDWDLVKNSVMRLAVLLKFTQSNGLAEKLLDTEEEELIEGNHWHDNYWGQCSCVGCEGEGENHLGHIIMGTRQILLGV